MKTEIVAKNYRVSDRLREIVELKVAKLDKYFPNNAATAKVVMTDLGRQCKMELSIIYEGVQVRAEVIGDTMYYNIDDCLPKIERQIVKHRGKLNKKKKMPVVDDYAFISDVEMETVEIAKTKKFPISAMTPLEAAENLDMLGHDFYLFINDANNNVEFVYRSKDGTIGHLQPHK